MKKTIVLLIPVALFFFFAGAAVSYFEPRVEELVLQQIRALTEAKSPVLVAAEEFEIHFLPPSVELKKIHLQPKDPHKLGFDHATVEAVRANLDFLQLLAGHIALSTVVIEKPEIEIDADILAAPKKTETSELPVIDTEMIFKIVKQIPLTRLAVVDISLGIESGKSDWRVDLDDTDFLLLFQSERIGLQADLNLIDVRYQNKDEYADLQLDAVLTPEQLTLKELRFSTNGALVKVTADTKNIHDLLKNPSGNIQVELKSDLGALSFQMASFMNFPSMKGNVYLVAQSSFQNSLLHTSSYEMQSKEVSIKQFEVGDVWLKGTYDNSELQVPLIQITNNSGQTDVTNLNLKFQHDKKNIAGLQIAAKLKNDGLDLHDLLSGLGVGDIPLEIIIGADFDCGGPLYPDFKLTCKGTAEGSHLEARSGPAESSTIVRVDEFGAAGEVTVSSKEVTYKADLNIAENKGTSEGVINYDTGFVIKYGTPELNFKDINYLSNLKLEGRSALSGETRGDSHTAAFNINIDGKDVYFEDYKFGALKGFFRYDKSRLFFENMQGTVGASKYNAVVTVDLNKKNIQFDGQSTRLDAADLVPVFERHFPIPVELSGIGQFRVSGNGPLLFNQLSYIFQAQIANGTAAGESYDRLDLDVRAKQGEVTVQKASIVKHNSLIVGSGQGHSNGQIDFNIRGDKFLLEESENVSRLGANISGLLDFNLKLTGHVLNPDVNLKGNLTQLIIEDQEFPPSSTQISFTRKSIEGTAQLLGQRLKAEFVFPLIENAPFHLKTIANDWNFTTVFALIGGGNILSDYTSSLTGEIDLSSDSGGFFAASGKATIDKFLLQRGNLHLKNSGPVQLQMKSGLMTLNNFRFSGEQTLVELSGENFSKDNLNVRMKGQANLRLFQIFLPFMEELSGQAKIQAHLSGALQKPELLGSTQIKNAYVKLKGFPHAFEKMDAEAEFSHTRIAINKLDGSIGGGIISGDGSVQILGFNNLPVTLRARIDNATFNVPDHVRTTGDAEISVSGSWFPFTLAGTYRVKSGLIDKEFGDEVFAGGLRQSSYLPKMLLQGAFEPLLLDIQVLMDRGLQIKNSTLDGTVTGALQIKGTPTQPQLFGKMQSEKGTRLFFRDKPFEVGTASVQFSDPKEINPELFMTARARVTDYDINLLVQGTAKSPLLRLSSTPPLSENDIISLLALGMTSSRLEQTTAKPANNENAYQIGGAIISNTAFAKGLQQTGWNLNFSSSYDDTKNTAVQRVTLSRDISKKLNASTSYVRGQQSTTEVKLRYSFNPNVSAAATYERRESTETGKSTETQKQTENILGLDLEYKKEFK